MVRVMNTDTPSPPTFGADFQETFDNLLIWRRDVRRFKTDPLPVGLIDELLTLAALSPSVGNSQPWRFVRVISTSKRQAMRDHFQTCNADALNDYSGSQAKTYAHLKLSGMDQAPEQIAVFCDRATDLGHGLGKKTMPETLAYSVVMAIHTLWLAARTRGIGVGWVSIVEPTHIERLLETPKDWAFTAYLCMGWPQEEHDDPELVRHGWQERVDITNFITQR